MNVATILAAGQGKRFGAEVPKQFIEVLGRPVLAWTLETFQRSPDINAIQIVCQPEEKDRVIKIVRDYRIDKIRWITAGGDTCPLSIQNGVHALRNGLDDGDVFVLHMGVSPLVSLEDIAASIALCKEKGCCYTMHPIRICIHRLANPQAILLRAFGAEEVTIDHTDGGWWLSHNSATLEPDPELIEIFGMNPDIFPQLCAPGTLVGRVTPDVAERTGLKVGTPLYQGAVDQCCAALGAGNYGSVDIGTMCMGTAGVIMTYSEKPIPDPLSRYYIIHYPGGGYASEVAVPVAASAFRWVRDMLYPAEAFSHDDIYARMDAEAASVPIGSGGLCFLPLMAGSIYPTTNDTIRGGWIGASLSTTRAAMIRSALEGICYEMRQILEASGREFTSISILGGAARSDLWNQMQADIYGCPVETIVSQEASALGAAMIAAHGAGLYPSLKDAVCGMYQKKCRYEPDTGNAERYRNSYNAWLNCVDGLCDRAFPSLAKVRNEVV